MGERSCDAMHPANHPHELTHERQYPPYGPSVAPHVDHVSKGPVWICLALLLFAVSALWRMSQARSERWLSQPPEEAQRTSVIRLEPGESGDFRPAPVGTARLASPAEQTLQRHLSELERELPRTERLARRVGQQETFATFAQRHLALRRAVDGRRVPWVEQDCLRLDHQARILIKELTRFSTELEEVASVPL